METEPSRVQELVDRYRAAVRVFQQACDNWNRKLSNGSVKDDLNNEVIPAANEYFDIVDRELIPAVMSGPQGNAKAIALMKGRLRDLYERQKRATEKMGNDAASTVDRTEVQARESVRYWDNILTIINVVIVATMIGFGWWIARSIVGPTNHLIYRMKDMAEGAGDLTARVAITSNDEIGQLSQAINTVIGKIHDLVVKVRESSIQLYASSTEIAATAREQESTMQNLGASTNQIAAAVKQITATSQELSSTMHLISEGGKQTGSLAAAGKNGLAGMGTSMHRLAESTNSISGKLSVVREKANDINLVVTTITKVADQTNLLSINAAIEAEKAGEYGRGFLVVAREIRRLADQTAVATLDIENMVRQMQAAVSAGVMEMDKFTEEVRSGVSRVSEISTQMGQIIEQVHDLNGKFQSVAEGTEQQSAGARQINDAMVHLSAGVQQTSASLKEFHSVTVNLRESADALKQQVSRFTVKG